KTVFTYLNTVGTITAFESASIKPQVSGKIEKVLFKEGSMVKKGAPLLTLESSFYQAQLDQYKGQLLKDQALLENAKIDLKRYQNLDKMDSISKQALDSQKSLVKQYEGLVKYDQGLVDSALVNLSYCKITAPIDGVIGLRQSNPGNYVTPNDATPLTVVTQLSPISVVFSIPEDKIVSFKKAMSLTPLTADVFDKSDSLLLEQGQIQAIDSQIDTSTGTIKVRASLENKENLLYQGQFVNVHIKVESLENALVVPTKSIQKGKESSFVFTYDDTSRKVFLKPVKILYENKDETTAIEAEITDNQLVVTQGKDKILDGQRVRTVLDRKSVKK
ncbi:MAG TPA: efflux RND transporter periplasmic adaptor subunit, partial [Alphaproteobacteria bacterium]|nr:efflux RND transporter periplasmic adaptor subunit [Alphaproteobacteria bacterium]